MAARTIDGPEKEYMDLPHVAAFVGLSESTIKRLIAEGEFPRPMNPTNTEAGLKLWHWRAVVYWTLRVEMRPYLRPRKDKSEKKTPGHKGP